jgi:site-specific DNA-methyltransferase (adenine-specific)
MWLSSLENCIYGKHSGGFFKARCESPVWRMPTEHHQLHPTQKPLKLFKKLILSSSLTESIIFDPFLGSGTTAVAAAQLGRQFIGIEISREYCRIAEERLRRETQQLNMFVSRP